MTIQLDISKLPKSELDPARAGVIATQHQYPAPQAGVEGVSFPDAPMLRRALATSIIAVGTFTVGREAIDQAKGQNLTIELLLPPVDEPAAKSKAAEQFARLRSEMEQAGIPFLDDEELRREIKDRRGRRPEREV